MIAEGLDGIDLAAVARASVPVEAAVSRPQPARLSLPNAARNPFLGRRLPASAVHHHLLRDVVLDGRTLMLLAGGRLIRETAYCQAPEVCAALHERDPLPPPFSGRAIVAGSEWAWNYFHWMTQAVPAIDAALRRAPGEPVFLMLPPEKPFMAQVLARMGWASVPRLHVDPARQYRLPEAEWSGFVGGEATFARSAAAAATHARLQCAFAPGPPGSARVYVSRSDAPVRPMRGETALIEVLAARGFRILVPGALDVAGQAAALRDARLVVGAHGAGLTNLVFCGPQTVVLELLPARYPNACYLALADTVGVGHWGDAFADPLEDAASAEERAISPHVRSWDLDVAAVLERVRSLETVAFPSPWRRLRRALAPA